VRALLARVPAGKPFQVVMGGDKRGEDWEADRARIKGLADAGATWWFEYVPPSEPDVMREVVARGPLRVD
jgi:hypothetical protein